MLVLIIDSRERGTLPVKMKELVPDATIEALGGGDYLITTEQGKLLFERSTYADFIGKIISGRLWEQVDKCLQITNDVYFVLENPYLLRYTKFNVKALIGVMGALSRKVHVITTRSVTETQYLLMYFYNKYHVKREVQSYETRVKPRNMTDEEQALYCIMGINSVGEATAKKILVGRSIRDVANMEVPALCDFVSLDVARKINSVLVAKVK